MKLNKPFNGTTSLVIKITSIIITAGAIVLGAGKLVNQGAINTQDIASVKAKVPELETRVVRLETIIPEIKEQNRRMDDKLDKLLMRTGGK